MRASQNETGFARAVSPSHRRFFALARDLHRAMGMPRVLLAEDDDEMRDTLARELLRAGFTVQTAKDGLEALIWITQADFDVAVFDVRMPECTGLEVLMRLRERGSRVPCVLISGFADGLDGVGERYGAVVLSKPFPMDALRAAMRECLP